MAGPLDGVRIIEICSAISGPFACKLLGDMGAEVIKIESPGKGATDRIRDLPYDTHDNATFTWRFLNYNTSKSSVTLDLKEDAGKEVFCRLVEDADAVVENMRPGSIERLGFGWERLHAENPELVYCSIKGYGREGPYRDMPALDTLIQGLSGFATQVGSQDHPESTEILVVDMVTGLYAAWAVTAALYDRNHSERGQRIDISMLDAIISMLGHQLAEYTGAQHDEDYEPQYGPMFAPNGYFRAADDYLALFVIDDHWEGFCAAIDRDIWTDSDHKYVTNDSRLAYRQQLREDLEEILGERTVDEWMVYFEEHDATVLTAPVNDIDEMIENPQIHAQEAVVERTHPVLGTYQIPNVVPKFSQTPGEIDDAPGLGTATDNILQELGYDDHEREQLRKEGVVD
jgi:crotonobetainyl-CoA:carnitine CoA-transferase CaiB-like acyl-CoA transferase